MSYAGRFFQVFEDELSRYEKAYPGVLLMLEFAKEEEQWKENTIL